jgi:hypothetical protein
LVLARLLPQEQLQAEQSLRIAREKKWTISLAVRTTNGPSDERSA